MTPIPIKDMVREAGGASALARLLSVTRQTVHGWLRKGEPLAEVYQYTYLAKRPRQRNTGKQVLTDLK